MAKLLFVVAAVSTSCATVETRAIEFFSAAESCPASRIEIRQIDPPAMAPEPYPDDAIAQDPERLAVWSATQRDEREQRQAARAKSDWFAVAGCGAQATIRCTHHRRRATTDPLFGAYVSCFDTARLQALLSGAP